MSLKQAVLVVDSEMMHLNGETIGGIQSMVVCDEESALEAVRDRHLSLRGLLISDSPGLALKVLGDVHKFRTGIPIFFTGEKPAFEDADCQSLGVRSYLSRKLSYAEVLEQIQPLTVGFENEAAMMVSELTKVGPEEGGDFTPIRADNFLSGHQSLFDIYVRLSEQKYFKICSSGSKFDELRVSNYINKGITHFYLRKEAQKSYLDFCRFLTQKLIGAPEVAKEVKVAQTLNYGEQTIQFLGSTGLRSEDLQAAVDYSNTVREMLDQIAPNGPAETREFIKDLSSYDHGVAVTMLASLMASRLGHQTNFGVGALGLASLLHDIGLIGLSETARGEDESKMSFKERTAYRKHPLVGAEIISRVPGISPVAVKGIENHHVRNEKMGFPVGIEASSISSVAEMIGIAHEFHHLIAQGDEIDPLAQMKEQVFKGFSPQMVRIFSATFLSPNS